MKITKYVHSCLLVENNGMIALCDPGQFSWESGLFSLDRLNRLDYITITHEHFDHFYEPFVQAVVEKFPNVAILTNPTIAAKLQGSGIQNVHTEGDENIELFATEHESVEPVGNAPDHTGVHIFGKLTHPGDSHHVSETKEVLALPMTAPWGSFMNAMKLAISLQPKFVVPIHDWHWNEIARERAYGDAESFLAQHNITFIKTQDSVSFEV